MADVELDDMALASISYRSVMTNTNLFSCSVLGGGPRICMRKKSRGPSGSNSFSCRGRFSCIRFFAYEWQSQTVTSISFTICS